MSAPPSSAVSFPPGFLFGTATAAYQIEGSVTEGDRGVSIWDTFSHTPGKVLNGDNGDVTSDHYRRLEEDLDLLSELGAPAYRFSVSWPRIQPTGKGPANQDGLDFYRRLVDGLRDRSIAPVLTLYHWDLPQPLEDAGGWPVRDTAERFSEYASILGQSFGSEVEMWITLNEPWCSAWLGYAQGRHAPGEEDLGKAAAATHHLLLAHGQAASAIRAESPEAKVGITLNLGVFRPASEHEDDLAAVRRADGNANRIFLDPLFKGEYPADMLEHYARHRPGFEVIREGDLDQISTPLDFLGVNFYSPHTVAAPNRLEEAKAAGFSVAPPRHDLMADDLRAIGVGRTDLTRSAMGWEIDASGLGELLRRLSSEHPGCPIYVTENGNAFEDYVDPNGAVHDSARIAYLENHLRAVAAAMESGADVRGYFVWSFLDNFEWALGFSKRFGLVWVDYPTGERTPKDSYYWYRDVVRARGLGEVPAPS